MSDAKSKALEKMTKNPLKGPHIARMRSMGFAEHKVLSSARKYKSDYELNKETESYRRKK